MNLFASLGTIVAASRKHPWLMVILILAIVAHGADLQWPGLHKFLSTVAYGFFAVALLYASGTGQGTPGAEGMKVTENQNNQNQNKP